MKDSKVSQLEEADGTAICDQTNTPQRILVVDDDLCIRQLSAAVLVSSGYEVDTAEDGEAGWETLHTKNYDLLITDNNMPRVSGVELVKKLRSEDVALPVIMVSGARPLNELNRHPLLQVSAIVLKPFTIEELVGTVKKVLCAAGSDRSRTENYFPVMTGAISQAEPLTRRHQ